MQEMQARQGYFCNNPNLFHPPAHIIPFSTDIFTLFLQQTPEKNPYFDEVMYNYA